MHWLWVILIGLVAGYLGSRIVRGSGSGLILNLVIGLIGALLGGWLFGLFGLGTSNLVGTLITATVGSVVLLWVVNLFTPQKKR